MLMGPDPSRHLSYCPTPVPLPWFYRCQTGCRAHGGSHAIIPISEDNEAKIRNQRMWVTARVKVYFLHTQRSGDTVFSHHSVPPKVSGVFF